MATNNPTVIEWQENGQTKQAIWQSENNARAPKTIQIADDTIKADAAYKLACEGSGLLWRGDYENAKHLLQAIKRRILKPKKKSPRAAKDLREAFHIQRQAQSHQARIMGMLLIELTADNKIDLRRSPDIQAACEHAYGKATDNRLVSLRELLGVIGAYEWHKKGLQFDCLPHPICPAYGVFAPTRHEYLDLVNQTPLPENCQTAMDIGVGTGVISAILANRGVANIIATDCSLQAIDCARRNLKPYQDATNFRVIQANIFPADTSTKADLIVCNPPWLPARPSSELEAAVYDEQHQMLIGFLSNVIHYLNDNGEVWLILSDLAELLSLRTKEMLLALILRSGLEVNNTWQTQPKHQKASKKTDPLYLARKAEVTRLWQLKIKN